ncbi:hypothetical protein [Serratia fonticola]|uniref:Uncharacterized protein n=1 Tax=Serratia fonticola TaxID=47917 RepID=A0ABY9PIZ7_SERFO|nr:hypothetical protein [Serratia fonticola]WMT13389.1 hypothetical protein RFB13_19425 [Serratia fonticola]
MSKVTVKQLRAKLSKMPANALIAWRDHDQSADEINNWLRDVDLHDAGEVPFDGVDDETPVVVLGP